MDSHLIDTSTKYSGARMIKIKRREEIVCNIFLMWISYFGPPKCFLSDNGRELYFEGYQYMNKKLNIETHFSCGKSIQQWHCGTQQSDSS